MPLRVSLRTVTCYVTTCGVSRGFTPQRRPVPPTFKNELQVNISEECREKVLATDVTAYDIFDDARAEVLEVMEVSAMPNFHRVWPGRLCQLTFEENSFRGWESPWPAREEMLLVQYKHL